MRKTLENYEAFQVMAHRTQNMQVVDHKEINLHLHRSRREARAAAQQAADMSRREAHKETAVSLAQRATQFDGPLLRVEQPGEDALASSSLPPAFAHGRGKDGGDVFGGRHHPSRILGWPHAGSSSSSSAAAGTDVKRGGEAKDRRLALSSTTDRTERAGGTKGPTEEVEDELPPWELTAREEEFDITTGRFGDPTMGTFRELSDSNIRLLPQHEAEKKWRVDAGLLPLSLKRAAREAREQEEKAMGEVEREYQRRRQYTKYRKWDGLLSRVQEKRRLKQDEAERSEEDAAEEENRRRRRATTEKDRLSVVSEVGEEEEEGGGERGSHRTSSFNLEGDLPLFRRRPIPPGRRLSQLLRKGEHRQRVSPSLRKRFSSMT